MFILSYIVYVARQGNRQINNNNNKTQPVGIRLFVISYDIFHILQQNL